MHQFLSKWVPELAGQTSDSEGTRLQGLTGMALEWLDNKKHEEALKKFAQTPAGEALLDYAAKRDIPIKKTYDRDSGGTYYHATASHAVGEIVLNANKKTEDIVSVMAHEIRHAWQQDRIGKLLSRELPPAAFIAINRAIEADAYLFQRKFCEDYAEKTGDHAPLKSCLRGWKHSFPGAYQAMKAGAPDEECFFQLMQDLYGSGYDVDAVHRSNVYMDFCESEKGMTGRSKIMPSMISPAVSDKLIHAAVLQIDQTWPLTERYAAENYLGRHKEDGKPAVLAAKDRLMSKEVSGLHRQELTDAKNRYETIYNAKKKPAPSSLKAPGSK